MMPDGSSNTPVWIITTKGQVAPLSGISSSEEIKWWCYEGDEKWQREEPPNTVKRSAKKNESKRRDGQIQAF
jgi:hypothetical protein